MIVVTGATGNVGRPLVRALVAAGERVTALARRISAADIPAGARSQQGDLGEPESLKPALDGADALFLLTPGEFMAAGGSIGDVLGAARAGGVHRVVLLSSQGVATGRHPSALEDAVTGSGLAWTLLRPGGFHSNALTWAAAIQGQRAAAAPFGDVALPTVDPADIADVAAVTLRDASHAGTSYELTGPAPISPRQQAMAIARELGEPVRFTELSREEARTRMLRYMPQPAADTTLDILGTPTAAEQRVSPDIGRVLGRRPRTFAEWVSRHVTAFR